MSIKIQNTLINFYGNPAGFIKDKQAVVDSMFEGEELREFLTEKGLDTSFKDGVFEKLSLNRHYYETEDATPLKNVRIWQLKNDVDVGMKFVSLDEVSKGFGEPNAENYAVIYDGELNTNDLEEIYSICNNHHPQNYKGHSLSISDVVELYDEDGSNYHYCDRFGFKEIDFTKAEQTHSMEMEIQHL